MAGKRIGDHQVGIYKKLRTKLGQEVAAAKLMYLASRNISKKWPMSIGDWKASLNRFIIVFEGRVQLD